MYKWTAALVLVVLTGINCWSQDAEVKKPEPAGSKDFYQLNFVLREIDGERVINMRSYSVISGTSNSNVQIRADEKLQVPILPNGTSLHQVEVGVHIDTHDLHEVGNRMAVSVTADISSLTDEKGLLNGPPVIRSNQWTGNVAVTLKQPTVIFSSDDPASTRKMQLQLTVTPLH